MARFLPLHITDIRRDTRDAVVVTLAPAPKTRRPSTSPKANT